MPKRQRMYPPELYGYDSEVDPWSSSFESESEAETAAPAPKRRAPKAARAPLYKATVTEYAEGVAATPSSTTVDTAILERIKKCLVKGQHGGTTEAEAKAALYLASKMMAQHNVTQAEVMETASEAEKALYAGRSIVRVERSDGAAKKVLNKGFTSNLSSAIEKFFDCKSFSVRRSAALDFTFYGIAQNTVSAALAFEMVYNLISAWSMGKGRAANSYSLGVARGLWSAACAEKRQELRRAKQSEKGQQYALEGESQRASHSSPKKAAQGVKEEHDDSAHSAPSDGFGDEASDAEAGSWGGLRSESEADFKEDIGSNDDDAAAKFEDVDDEIKHLAKNVKTEPPTIKTEESETEELEGAAWRSERQLTVFRETAEQVAKQYLSTHNITTKHGRRPAGPKSHEAYTQGKEDSRKIDVRRRRIEGEAWAPKAGAVKAIRSK